MSDLNKQVSNEDESFRMISPKDKQKKKRWAFRIVFICLVIFIWVLYIAPLLGGMRGILVATIEVIEPDVNYSNRNNTMHAVYNDNCNITNVNTYSLAYNWTRNTTFNGTCPQMYVFNGTLCVPQCIRWNPGGEAYFWLYRVLTILGPVIQLFMCLLFTITWIQAGKSVWRFPTITSFYLMITLLIQALAVLAGSLVPEKFYCSSVELAKSREFSTIACKLQGAIFQYGIFSFMLWYLTAFVNLTLLVAFPLNVNKIMKHRNKIHILEFLICFLAPILVVLISYFGDPNGPGYRIENVPEFCIPQDEFTFITLYLPGILFSLILGTLSMVILYKLFTQQFVSTAGMGLHRTLITDLAFQVIVFLISFGVLIWIIMIDFIVYENLRLPFRGFLDEYSRCLTDFNGDDTCCRPVFRTFYSSWLSTLAGFSTTVWGTPALLALAARVIKQKCCSFSRETISNPHTKSTSVTPGEMRRLHSNNTNSEKVDEGYCNPVSGFKRTVTLATQTSFYDDFAPKKSERFKKQASSSNLISENNQKWSEASLET